MSSMRNFYYKVNIEDKEGYIYVLLEAQSTPDELMAFRLLEYMVQIMRRHIDKQSHQKQPETLPLILPLVFYSGTKPADGFKRDIMDRFAQPELARHYFMQPFTLISMRDTPDDEIMKGKLTAAVELIQKHITARDITLYIEDLIKIGALRRLYQIDGDLLLSMLKYITMKGQISQPEQLFNKLVEHLPGEENEMATIAEHFEQKGKLDVAKNLLALGKLTPKEIAKVSGVSTDEIENLKNKKH